MRTIAFFLAALAFTCCAAQDPDGALELVLEGVQLHDEGRYEQALERYAGALELDSVNFTALYEQSLTLFKMGRYEDCVALCERTLDVHGATDGVEQIYIAMGNSQDLVGQPEEALQTYARGLAVAPEFYLLHFNRGITLSRLQRLDDAVEAFQSSIQLDPSHPGSHQALGHVMLMQGQRIPALLALSRFLFIEPRGGRAEKNLPVVRDLLGGNVERNDKGGVTIRIDPGSLKDPEDSTARPNDFGSVEMMVSMSAALDIDQLVANELAGDKGRKKKKKATAPSPPHRLFLSRFEALINTLEALREGESGFFWEYYVPWFVELKQREHQKTAAHVMQASARDAEILAWLDEHRARVAEMYDWDKAYDWGR